MLGQGEGCRVKGVLVARIVDRSRVSGQTPAGKMRQAAETLWRNTL